MSVDRRRVEVTEDREEVALVFQRYNLISAPVVDEGERLVGVITIDDVVDVIQEEADANLKALGGVSESERIVGYSLGDDEKPLRLAVRQSADRFRCFFRAWRV